MTIIGRRRDGGKDNNYKENINNDLRLRIHTSLYRHDKRNKQTDINKRKIRTMTKKQKKN